jgi:dTMP kinase
MFVVIEGIDGAGTTTLGQSLVDLYRENFGGPVTYTHEPWQDPVKKSNTFKLIMNKIQGQKPGSLELALLFAVNRLEHVERLIGPWSHNGLVVCDRYILSSMAYQYPDVEYVEKINSIFPRPDATIILDLPPEKALERMVRRQRHLDNFEKDLDFQRTVRQKYLEYAGKTGDRFLVIDALETPDLVLEKSRAFIDDCRKNFC